MPSPASQSAVAANRAAPPNALTSRQYQGVEGCALRVAYARSRRSSTAPGALAFVGAFTSMPPAPDGAPRATSHKDSVEPFESTPSAERGPGHNARPAAGSVPAAPGTGRASISAACTTYVTLCKNATFLLVGAPLPPFVPHPLSRCTRFTAARCSRVHPHEFCPYGQICRRFR